ncbi:alpha/beta-hydrolase [Flagelloscypha sp. PMI_526]|nr:alpha/beta-hydrolase [Flagelloscypha sp. PMI_526]
MAPTVAPYGSWSTPLSPETIVKGANSITEAFVDDVNGQIFHIESRPSEKGRNVVVDSLSLKDVVGKDVNVRSSVHEYGGGHVTAHDGFVYYSNFADGRVYRVKSDGSGEPQALTPETKVHRFADFRVHPINPDLLVSVLEDHTNPRPSDVTNTLVIINASNQTVTPLKSGADFYASPAFSPDGQKLTYQQWFHPDMPWEAAEIVVADLNVSDTISISTEKTIAGKKLEVSVGWPRWLPNNRILFESDETGFQNPYVADLISGSKTPLYKTPVKEDFTPMSWVLGRSRKAILNGGTHALYSSLKDGRATLRLIEIGVEPSSEPLDQPFSIIQTLHHIPSTPSDVVFVASTPTKSSSIYRATIDLKSRKVEYKDLKDIPPKFSLDYVSVPQPYTLRSDDNPLHVVVYMPANPEFIGPENEKPPAIFHAHGGPTAIMEQGLEWQRQYFTSSGFVWIDVNYGGSAGYGRAYTGKLEGKWGVVDIEDCILAAKLLSSPTGPHSLVDPKRMFIRGGSAGGYTVLGAASLPAEEDLEVFAGGASLYGISDLVALADETHKFESRYGEKLIGGMAAVRGEVDIIPICKERSPVNNAERIRIPLLLLQGEIDRVVPKEQSQAILDTLKSRGGDAELVVYEGEGHGFRQEANVKDALERELGFYKRILKL